MVSTTNDLPRGAAVMRDLDRALERPEAIVDAYAQGVLDVARRAAAGHPTPQARMAASGLVLEAGAIVAPSGAVVSGRGGSARLADLIWGAEFGSTTYRQFGPRQARGAWLFPSTDDRQALAPAERALADLVADAARA